MLTLLLLLLLLLVVVLGEAIDSLATPRRRIFFGDASVLAWRASVTACIGLLAFGLTARPLLTLVATLASLGALVAVSNAKQRTLREPLVFSDFALLEHVWRHPHLFYLPTGWRWALPAGVAALIAGAVIWMLIEPRAVSEFSQAVLLSLVVAAVAVAVLWPAALSSMTLLVGEPEPQSDVARIGLLLSLMAYYIGWRLAVPPHAGTVAPHFPPRSRYDTVVVVQAEAFVDLRRLGYSGLHLPAFDRLQATALSSGLLEVPCQGAYTLRPESAAISGRGFAQQGFDRFHPYLRPGRIAGDALPRRLASAGWDTLFVHPHDASFFRRGHAIPALGFARLADERAFAEAPRTGPYVADQAVADFLLDEVQASAARGRRLFAYAVTMEAHDPYGLGRFPDEDDPVRQYVRHIENTDRMLARLADRLANDDHRVLLVFFGDHVPLLSSFADPFPDTRTDYFVVELGRNASREPSNLAVARPEHLYDFVCACLAGSTALPPDFKS